MSYDKKGTVADLGRGASNAGAATLVAGAAIANAFKEIARGPNGELPGIPPVGDLLFDLADIQVKNMESMAKASQAHAKELLDYLKQQKGVITGRSPLPRALVSATLPDNGGDGRTKEQWPFKIKNKSGEERTYTLPDLAEFVRVGPGECEDSVFVPVEFFDKVDAKIPNDVVKVPAEGLELQISFHHDPRFGAKPARFRASVILEASKGLPLELLVELLQKNGPPDALKAP